MGILGKGAKWIFKTELPNIPVFSNVKYLLQSMLGIGKQESTTVLVGGGFSYLDFFLTSGVIAYQKGMDYSEGVIEDAIEKASVRGWSKIFSCLETNKNGNQEDDRKDPIFDMIKIVIEVIIGNDPNEIIGPQGYGDKKWVSIKSQLPYKILFENTPEIANGPAQRVTIYLPLPSTLNSSSLRLGDFGFGNFNFSVPPNLAAYSKRLDLKDSLGLYVDVIGGLDIPNNRAFWTFQSIDPATGLAASLPPLTGFLPVNDSITHKGEGYVSFNIQPAVNAHTLDTVELQASIIFDTEQPVATNTWTNTIDAVAPISSISILPTNSFPDFPVSWTAKDDTLGSGLKNYDIYYSKNNGPYNLLSTALTSNGLQFPGGDIGATYSFFSIATDNTDNREPFKTAGETSTTVVQQFESICSGSNLSFNIPSFGIGYTYKWQVDPGTGFVDINDDAIYSGSNTNVVTLTSPPTSWYGNKYRCIATNGSYSITGTAWVLKFKNTWKGTTSAAWETASNWNCNKVPDEYTDVYIDSAVPNNPVLSSNGLCRSLNLSNGSVFKVKAGFTLQVKGR